MPELYDDFMHEESVAVRRSNKVILLIALFVIVMGVIIWFAGTHYVVNTRSGIKIYPKSEFTFTDVYVDMRNMPFTELRRHKELVIVMIEHGDIMDLPGGDILEKVADAGKSVMDAINRFDDEYQVSEYINEIIRAGKEMYQEIDEKYGISDKAEEVKEYVEDATQKLNDWIKSR